MLFLLPDIIWHECTIEFPVSLLMFFFAELYAVYSVAQTDRQTDQENDDPERERERERESDSDSDSDSDRQTGAADSTFVWLARPATSTLYFDGQEVNMHFHRKFGCYDYSTFTVHRT